ncbi:uncharacterized protein [Palaemon carinicauda]|uniref:uncharacterized protein n=1 Tax=Palaemon carinicauda TaxID=392227 RepID=UPI0035B68293
MKVQMMLFLVGTITMAMAAPQFDFNNNQPTPYSFAYGVSSPDTGDEKEHKETVSPSGVTEGEFRWLQPNGLFRITRYTADDASGFRAIVSEEPGERVGNYYTNTQLGGSVEVPSIFPIRGSQQSLSSFQSGNQQIFSGFQSGNQLNSNGFQSGNQLNFNGIQSGNSQSFNSFGSGNRIVTSSQNFQNQGSRTGQNFQTTNIGATQNQGFGSSFTVQNQGFTTLPVQSFTTVQNIQPQRINTFTVSQPSQSSGNIIDGGIIDGGIVSGGIVDGGIVGTTSTSFDSGFNQFNPNSFNAGSSLNNFGGSRFSSGSITQGIPVILANGPNQFSGVERIAVGVELVETGVKTGGSSANNSTINDSTANDATIDDSTANDATINDSTVNDVSTTLRGLCDCESIDSLRLNVLCGAEALYWEGGEALVLDIKGATNTLVLCGSNICRQEVLAWPGSLILEILRTCDDSVSCAEAVEGLIGVGVELVETRVKTSGANNTTINESTANNTTIDDSTVNEVSTALGGLWDCERCDSLRWNVLYGGPALHWEGGEALVLCGSDTQILMALIGTITMASAAPQFDFNNNQPTPYSFAYGVSSPDTGDEKEHKETVSPSGVTEGVFRWLQPNGLYRTTRYTADAASGFRAIVSEEPGERIGNYYTNSRLGGSVEVPSVFPSRGNQQFLSGFQSGNPQIFNSFNAGSQIVTSSQNFQNLGSTTGQNFLTTNIGATQNQGFTTFPVQGLTTVQNIPPQRITSFTVSQPSQSSGNLIDGGIIDGGIVSGGFIDSGIVGTTSFDTGFNQFNTNSNSFNTGSSLNNFGSTPNIFRFDGSRLANANNGNRGVSVLLANEVNRFRS